MSYEKRHEKLQRMLKLIEKYSTDGYATKKAREFVQVARTYLDTIRQAVRLDRQICDIQMERLVDADRLKMAEAALAACKKAHTETSKKDK